MLIGKLGDIAIGMACTIETYAGRYSACSLLPLGTSTLRYGSNTAGIHVALLHENCMESIKNVATQLNLKKHVVMELGSQSGVEVELPYNVQVHWDEGSRTHFMHMCHRLWVECAPDLTLRMEVTSSYSTGELEAGYEFFTWKNPSKCHECDKYISEYEYYAFEKYSLNDNKTLLHQYLCCLSCYDRLLPSRGFKAPFHRLVLKSVPPANRLIYWRNPSTILYTRPSKRVALNADAFDRLCEADAANRKDRATITVLLDKLRQDTLDELIDELEGAQDAILLDAEHLSRLAHGKGINLRLLGRVTYQTAHNYVREIAVILILSRGIKHLLLEALHRLDLAEDPRDILVSYVNHILSLLDTPTSKLLWDQLAVYVLFASNPTRSKSTGKSRWRRECSRSCICLRWRWQCSDN